MAFRLASPGLAIGVGGGDSGGLGGDAAAEIIAGLVAAVSELAVSVSISWGWRIDPGVFLAFAELTPGVTANDTAQTVIAGSKAAVDIISSENHRWRQNERRGRGGSSPKSRRRFRT